MDVEHRAEQYRFVVEREGEEAVVEYRMSGESTIELYHTEVPDSLEGEGVGSALARTALEYAKSSGYKVIASCQFIRRWLERHHEYDDLISSRG